MDSLHKQPLKRGLINLPGATPASTALVEELMYKDVTEHHCFFNDQYFHNHLAHHILTLHDLGAPAESIQKFYDQEAAIQRPLHHHDATKSAKQANGITKENWREYLGEVNAHMYPDYLAFFSSEIEAHGVARTLEKYVFSPEANGNGTMMLGRFVGGLLHPMIEVGFGIEFGQDGLVAEGLAQGALTTAECAAVMDMPAGVPEIKTGPSRTLLSLLREVYDSPELTPLPYSKEPISFEKFTKWLPSHPAFPAKVRQIYSAWTFDDFSAAEIDSKLEECMWQATLLLGATSKEGRKPRMDFFMMHFLTGSLLMRVVLDKLGELKRPIYQAQLLQTFARSMAVFVFLRGRPVVDCNVVMGYSANPGAGIKKELVNGTSKGAESVLNLGNPWLPILDNAALHPEAHVVKAIRSLFYCAQHFGGRAAGKVIGAVDVDGERKEMHPGVAKLDGTLFIRVAGALCDALGWVTRGEKDRFWDFRGGWEEAWAEADD
ncbi:P-loop containing nucleoside triphosphate hydrolase protein [Favolaschia claudopus]|uniref:P-loop containing nucleoside triphosphate hydrolase protein n=1 Tax=Favolaschia claudopus TaxID=2862362 RepID=A0AAW0E9Z7_9AGAR